MPLATSKELLLRALENHYAIGAFNANNMEQIQAIVEAAEEERAPVILQVSQGAIRYVGLELAAGMVKTIAKLASVPVVLHLDHGTDYLQNTRCFRVGFTSLMYDGSGNPTTRMLRPPSGSVRWRIRWGFRSRRSWGASCRPGITSPPRKFGRP